MTSEPSWLLLAIALALVLALTGLAAWLAVTEVRAVRPAATGRRVRGGTTTIEQQGQE
jgi:acyl dehydratase